jgi:hypothetical protein
MTKEGPLLDRAIEHAVGLPHNNFEEHKEQGDCWRCNVWKELYDLRDELAAAKRVAGELAVELMDREDDPSELAQSTSSTMGPR